MRKLKGSEVRSQSSLFLSFSKHQGPKFGSILFLPPGTSSVLCLPASCSFRALLRSRLCPTPQCAFPFSIALMVSQASSQGISAFYATCSGSGPCTLALFGPQFPLCNGGGSVGEPLEAPSSPAFPSVIPHAPVWCPNEV